MSEYEVDEEAFDLSVNVEATHMSSPACNEEAQIAWIADLNTIESLVNEKRNVGRTIGKRVYDQKVLAMVKQMDLPSADKDYLTLLRVARHSIRACAAHRASLVTSGDISDGNSVGKYSDGIHGKRSRLAHCDESYDETHDEAFDDEPTRKKTRRTDHEVIGHKEDAMASSVHYPPSFARKSLPGTYTDKTLSGTSARKSLPGTYTVQALPGISAKRSYSKSYDSQSFQGPSAKKTLPGFSSGNTSSGINGSKCTSSSNPESRRSKKGAWDEAEHEAILEIIQARREFEEVEGLKKWRDTQFWSYVSDELEGEGFSRTPAGCKNYWSREGRQKSGFEERANPPSDGKLVSSAQGPKKKGAKIGRA